MSGGASWGWLTDHWRLKLLAGVLAVILFGTVAFAQNPITPKTFTVPIDHYAISDPNLALVRYAKSVNVQVVGLANAISPLTRDDFTATMDLSKVTAPDGAPRKIQADVTVQTLAPGVTVQQPPPLFVTIDHLTSPPAVLPIRVLDQPAPGVTIDKVVMNRASTTEPISTVTVTGPASIVNDLQPYVDLGPIAGAGDFVDRPIKFQDSSGREVKWPPQTVPLASVDVNSVDVIVSAHQTLQQKQVAPTASLTGTPACGYQMQNISFSPQFVTLSADADTLAGLPGSISLAPIDVSGATSNVVSRERVTAPPNTLVSPVVVTVTITFKQVASCAPASPTATPTPSPSPSP